MNYIQEQLKTPILGEYDLIVAGGGVAGVCAAVTAKRAGISRVLLLEKSIQFGGLATHGLISLFEPICDGKGHKVTYGMAEELMQLCMRYGPDTLPEEWRGDPDEISIGSARYKTFYSPAIFTLVLDEFVESAGVEVLFDTQVVQPIMSGKRCDGLIVENKTGRGCYLAEAVIDATGDADILYRAGVPCVVGKNYLTHLSYKADLFTMKNAVDSNNVFKSRIWNMLGADPSGKGHPEWAPMLSGTTAEEITQFVKMGRKLLFDDIREDDRWTRDVTVLPTMPQLRTTRHIVGAYTVGNGDVNRRFEDSVGSIPDFWAPGDCYEIPYRALYHPEYPNLWTAGRSVAADDWAWVILRVIPGVACSGQAAGMAAAMCIKQKKTAAELSSDELIHALKEQGIRQHAPFVADDMK